MSSLVTSPLYLVGLALSVAVCAGATYVAWGYRDRPGGVALVGFLLGTLLWSLTALAGSLSVGTPLLLFWLKAMFFGGALATVAFFVFAVSYTGRGHYLTPRVLALLAVEPVVIHLFVWSNPAHELVMEATKAQTPLGYSISFGPVFWIHLVYGYLLLFVASALLVGTALRAAPFYRKQALGFLAVIAVPWIANVVSVFGPVGADVTPLAFTVMGGLLVVLVRDTGLVGVTPAAREAVLENVSEAVFVVDDSGTLVDLNPVARALLEVGDDRVRGRDLETVVAASESLDADALDLESDEFEMQTDDRHYRASVSNLEGRGGRTIGRIVLVRDVTEQRRRERELEQKNERLDRFASVVSHDLRNPLQIAESSVELELDDHDENANLERALDALERMDTLIEDVLKLARQGDASVERGPTSLRSAAKRAWDLVSTAEASLDVEDAIVVADDGRLVEVFENLFRNAVEHGGTDVTVRVGPLEDGFYVEDDGPGLSDDHGDVFEFGVSEGGGTGLGLAIVRTIAQAHGWSVEAGESDDGGARFVFRDVELVEQQAVASPRTDESRDTAS